MINTVEAQRRTSTVKWFSLAAKAGIGNSVLLNVDLIEDGNVDLSVYTLSQSYGGRFTFTIGDNIGFGTELLFSSYGQKYDILNNETSYIKEISMKGVDLLPFFRYSGDNGAYLEVGSKISTINTIQETNSIPTVMNRDNLMQFYENKFTSLVFGFGTALYKSERIDVNAGIRMAYSFKDITPYETYNVTADGYYIPDYTKSHPTNPLSVQAIIELNYFFAFWGTGLYKITPHKSLVSSSYN